MILEGGIDRMLQYSAEKEKKKTQTKTKSCQQKRNGKSDMKTLMSYTNVGQPSPVETVKRVRKAHSTLS